MRTYKHNCSGPFWRPGSVCAIVQGGASFPVAGVLHEAVLLPAPGFVRNGLNAPETAIPHRMLAPAGIGRRSPDVLAQANLYARTCLPGLRSRPRRSGERQLRRWLERAIDGCAAAVRAGWGSGASGRPEHGTRGGSCGRHGNGIGLAGDRPDVQPAPVPQKQATPNDPYGTIATDKLIRTPRHAA